MPNVISLFSLKGVGRTIQLFGLSGSSTVVSGGGGSGGGGGAAATQEIYLGANKLSNVYIGSNPVTAVYIGSTLVWGGGSTSSWTDPDLANASYDNKSFNTGTVDTSLVWGLYVKPDGTKFYVVASGDTVYQYTASTANDVSTITYDNTSFSVSAQETNASNVFFKPDGTKFYIIGGSGDDVNEYNLSTAWDISTASYNQNFSVSSQTSAPRDVVFKPDGTKMYVLDAPTDDVFQYSLSTAWDVSTASYDSKSLDLSTEDSGAFGMSFNPDGTKMWFSGFSSDSVYQYGLSTAWDISTASYDSVSFSLGSQTGEVRAMRFNGDGSKLFIIEDTGKKIYQYST